MFECIKAVTDTVLGMINAAYYDKPLIFTGPRSISKACHDNRHLSCLIVSLILVFPFAFTNKLANDIFSKN